MGRRPSRRCLLRPRLVPLLVLLACACDGADERPRWISLSEPLASASQRSSTFDLSSAVGTPARFRREDAKSWLEIELPTAAWSPHGEVDDLWQATVSLRGRTAPSKSGGSPELFSPTARYRHKDLPASGKVTLSHLEADSFLLHESRFVARNQPTRLLLRLAPGEAPEAVQTLRLPLGDAGDAGEPTANVRIHGARFSGDGVAIWPDEEIEITTNIPAEAVLHFGTALEPALSSGPAARQPVFFAVELDGSTVFEHVVPTAAKASFAWHRVPLPPAGVTGGTLKFRLSGAPSHAAFFRPTIAPKDVGSYDTRPWQPQRPNVVIFLADTYRADNLAAYGGSPGVTPFLDELAKSSRVFRNAWAPATYTMASHAAMFSGYYARQTASTSATYGLAPNFTTLAEMLARAGYRTGAITDSGVVSAEFGLAQGFEWWDEAQVSLDSTLERAAAFLFADDGRPVFLFVQSYRAHAPYRASPESRRRLGATGSYGELDRRYHSIKRSGPGDPRRDATLSALETLYRAGSADLDTGFGAFHRSLVEHGILPDGVLIFTSDHGEAFGEHGSVYHNGPVWEEMTRIPFLITGGEFGGGVVNNAVSLMDLAPTVAELSGVEAPPSWPGRSLVRIRDDRPVFLFQNHERPGSTLAVVNGSDKLISYENPTRLSEGRVHARYDLASDPQETRDLAVDDMEAARVALERWRPELEALMTPMITPEPADLDLRKIEELKALGYLAE